MASDELLKNVRLAIAGGVLAGQSLLEQELPPEDGIPQLLGALLSISAHIAKTSAQLSRADFIAVCEVAANEIEE